MGILGADSSAANSFHHQGVRMVADGFMPVAYASDGLIEAIEAIDKTFMLGVQWHPEFFLGEKHMGNLFNALVEEAGPGAHEQDAWMQTPNGSFSRAS